MATNGNFSEDDLPPQNDVDQLESESEESANEAPAEAPKSALKKSAPVAPAAAKPYLPEQPEPSSLDIDTLTPLTPEIIARQATINIGTIGHVAHGKSTVVKAISGVLTVRFKNELERNITIKLGYANAKIYKCDTRSVRDRHATGVIRATRR